MYATTEHEVSVTRKAGGTGLNKLESHRSYRHIAAGEQRRIVSSLAGRARPPSANSITSFCSILECDYLGRPQSMRFASTLHCPSLSILPYETSYAIPPKHMREREKMSLQTRVVYTTRAG